MPLIEVTALQGTLNRHDQNTLMSQLSNAVLRSEGADVTDPAAQSLVWAYYYERPNDAFYLGGKTIEKAPLCIAVTTPQGAIDESRRNLLVKEIAVIVDGMVGPFKDRLNHWAMFHDISEGHWGGAGQLFSLAGIQAAMNIKPAE